MRKTFRLKLRFSEERKSKLIPKKKAGWNSQFVLKIILKSFLVLAVKTAPRQSAK